MFNASNSLLSGFLDSFDRWAATSGGLLVGTGPFLTSNREQIVRQAARHGVPTMYALRICLCRWPHELRKQHIGCVPSGWNIRRSDSQGREAADLPVMQSTKFELALNLKTAKALGLEIPDKLLAVTDEVIE